MTRWRAALAALVAGGAALRFATLGTQSFDSDELFTSWLVQLPFGEMLEAVGRTESTPYLYYVLAWGWTHVGGTFGETALRSLSALAGALTIPVVALAAARVAGRGTALVAAGLVAASPLLVWFSQQARAYALLTLLCALAALAALRVVEAPALGRLALWAGVSALAIATHYFAVLFVAPLAALILRRAPARRPALVALAAPSLAAAALVPLAWAQRDNPGGIEGVALVTRAVQVPKSFLIGFQAPAEVAATLLAAALAAASAAPLVLRSDRRLRAAAGAAAGLALVVVGVPALLALGGFDFLAVRNVLPAILPVLFVVAAGAVLHRTATAAAVGLTGLSVAIVVSVAASPRLQRADLRGVADALAPSAEPRALVVTPGTAPGPFSVYFPRARPMPAPGEPVAEIVVAATATQGQFGTGSPLPPRPASVPVPAGFRFVERRDKETYTLLRFQAPAARAVSAGELARLSLDPPAGVAVWVQSPE